MLQELRKRMRELMKTEENELKEVFVPTFKLSQLVDIEVEGIDFADYPDFCDAFISSGGVETWDGDYRNLTEEEIDWINDNCPDFVYESVQNQVF
jgi:hypothetical protein